MYRVYVDEAGDRGMKPASSDHFAVSAIIVATVALLGISLGLVGQISAVVAEAGSELTGRPGEPPHPGADLDHAGDRLQEIAFLIHGGQGHG